MSELVGNLEDRFSFVAAHFVDRIVLIITYKRQIYTSIFCQSVFICNINISFGCFVFLLFQYYVSSK